MSDYTAKDIERFWSHVAIAGEDECWNWQLKTGGNGYGKIKINKKHISAHRLAYTLAHGEIFDNLHVLHVCDNRVCCNPNHLFLGTALDNVIDMVSKKRHNRGETHGMHILTWDDVSLIRTLYENGEISIHALAREFGVCRSEIQDVVRYTRWKPE